MKQIFWTIPVTTPIHSAGTNIIIEKSINVRHPFGSYDLFVMYFENENERYWTSDAVSYMTVNKLAEMYKDVIQSSINIAEICKSY